MTKKIILLSFAFFSISALFSYAQGSEQKTREEQILDRLIDRYIRSSNFEESEKNLREALREIFRIGDEMIPPLLSRLKVDLENEEDKPSAIGVLIWALVILGDRGVTELKDILFNYPYPDKVAGSKHLMCHHAAIVTDPRCDYLMGDYRGIVPVTLSGRQEYLIYLRQRKVHVEMLRRQQPRRQKDFDRLCLIIDGAEEWLKRGGPKFRQSPGMSDEEAIQQLIFDFLATFERYIPWLILPDTEKGKPVKPGDGVSYYHKDERLIELGNLLRSGKVDPADPSFDEEFERLRREDRVNIAKVEHEIWEQEKMEPVNLTFDEITFSKDQTRVMVRIEFFVASGVRTDGYFFLLEKREGQWQFRMAYAYGVAVV